MSDMKHTPTPWAVSENAYGCFFIQNGVGRAMRLVAGGNNHGTLSGEDAAHIVKCVNLHEELVEIIKQYRCEIKRRKLEHDGHLYTLDYIATETLKKAGAL